MRASSCRPSPCPGETPELLALAATSDLIAGVVGWADLTAPGLTDRIAELTALPGGDKLVGLRHQVQSEADPQWLTRADVLRGLAAAAGAGLVYDLVITPGQLGAAGAVYPAGGGIQPSRASSRAISSTSLFNPRIGRTITVKATSLSSPFQRSMSTPWT